jgi:hypothetical protein
LPITSASRAAEAATTFRSLAAKADVIAIRLKSQTNKPNWKSFRICVMTIGRRKA